MTERKLHSRYVTISDQIVSSLSNFMLVVFVARNSSPTEFGQFSLGYIILVFFLGFQRSLVGEVLLVRFSNGKMTRMIQSHALGLTFLVGLLGGCVLAVGSVAAPAQSAAIWIVLAISCVVVLLQDSARYVFIARNESGSALLLDTIWAVLSIAVMAWMLTWRAAPHLVVAAWTVGAAVSLIIAMIMLRSGPRPVGGVRLFVGNKDISVRFAAEYSSLNLSTTVVWFALAGLLGSSGIAALRGASLLFSPLNTGFNAVRIAMIPELIRTRSTHLFRRRMLETGTILLAACLGWGVLVLLAPKSIGHVLLGSIWDEAATLRWPNFIQAIAMVGYTVVLAYYRATEMHRQSTWMRGVLAGATLAIPLAGAIIFNEKVAAAWGFAIAVAIAALLGSVLCGMRVRATKRLNRNLPVEVNRS